MRITKVYEQPGVEVQQIEKDGEVFPRVLLGSRVTVLLHDTVNDNVYVSRGVTPGSFVPTMRLPSDEMGSNHLESAVDDVNELVNDLTLAPPKSVSFMFQAFPSPETCFEPNSVYYCTFDSRGVPEENLIKGKDLIRLATTGGLNDMTTIAGALYLQLMRKGLVK